MSSEFVEQDLVLSRALVEIFSSPAAEHLALRGGTSLHKVILDTPARYSEDIDLVYTTAGPIGHVMTAIRDKLDRWLGTPRRKRKQMLTTMIYRFDAEATGSPMRLKIEINQVEKQSLSGIPEHDFAVDTPWFKGTAPVRTYHLEELLGTKLRALYQRRKGRDLFDLWTVHQQTGFDLAEVVRCFRHYVRAQGLTISQAEFRQNLEAKMEDPDFTADVVPLLPGGAAWAHDDAARFVRDQLLPLL